MAFDYIQQIAKSRMNEGDTSKRDPYLDRWNIYTAEGKFRGYVDHDGEWHPAPPTTDELNIPRNASEAVAQRQLEDRLAFAAEVGKASDPVETHATMGSIAQMIQDRIGETSSSDKHDTVQLPSDGGGVSLVSVFGGTPEMRAAAVEVLKQDVEGLQAGTITQADQGTYDDEHEVDEEQEKIDYDMEQDDDGDIQVEIEQKLFDETDAEQERYDALEAQTGYKPVPKEDWGKIKAKLGESYEAQGTTSIRTLMGDPKEPVLWSDLSLDVKFRLIDLLKAAADDLMTIFGVEPVVVEFDIMTQAEFEEEQDAKAEAVQGLDQVARADAFNRLLNPVTDGDRVLTELNKAANEGRLSMMHFSTKNGMSMSWTA